jgi:hypothetical protein
MPRFDYYKIAVPDEKNPDLIKRGYVIVRKDSAIMVAEPAYFNFLVGKYWTGAVGWVQQNHGYAEEWDTTKDPFPGYTHRCCRCNTIISEKEPAEPSPEIMCVDCTLETFEIVPGSLKATPEVDGNNIMVKIRYAASDPRATKEVAPCLFGINLRFPICATYMTAPGNEYVTLYIENFKK